VTDRGSTASGVERLAVRVYIYARLMNLAQIVLALPAVLHQSSHPVASLGAAFVCLITGGRISRVASRRGFLAADRYLAADVLASVLALGAGLFFVPSAQLFTWVNWPYAISLLTAVAVGVTVSRWATGVVALGLMAVYLLNAARDLPAGSAGTILTNGLAYLAFASIGHVLLGHMRNLAALADAGREAERQLALERARRHLHGPKSLLELLSRDDLDPEVRRAVRADAVLAAAELQGFLSGVAPATTELARELRELSNLFSDLPLVLNVDALDADLTPELTFAVREAVRTALQNVREHAEASQVVLYAESDQRGWEVTVNDDGRGFAAQPEGFGLATLVRSALAEFGATTEITSEPNVGTTVLLRGVL
jgi:anti-sigma regulatory factor (Ser/Thr protein kinase)